MNTLRNKLFCGAALCVLVMGGNAPAAPVVNVDGYVAMGGMTINTTNEYLLASNPGSEPMMGMQTWGYIFIGFDNLPNAPVASAVLTLQSIVQTSGMWPAPEDVPVVVGAYAAGIDLAGFGAAHVTAVQAQLLVAEPDAAALVSGGSGFYSWDVTAMLNAWIAEDGRTPFGVFLASTGEAIPRFHSSSSTTGVGPSLSYTAIPEPATLSLLGLGLAALRTLKRNRD